MEEIKTKGDIYVIGDLHLSLNEKTDKSMEVFGESWKNYISKIKENFNKKIKEEDVVIIAGDISWGMTLKESLEDLKFLNDLPGIKILLKGNHDYWWESKKKMNDFFEENNLNKLKILYNNSYNINGINIFGTKGWSYNEEGDFKNLRREGLRLKNSAESIDKEGCNICIMHYPPFLNKKDLNLIKESIDLNYEDLENINYIDIMKKYNTKRCYFGHLHGNSQKGVFEGEKDGIVFKLISADYINFDPVKIEKI